MHLPKVQRQYKPNSVHHELSGHNRIISGGDATMAKSFIIALEGPALTWYSRLPPLSIHSWKTLCVKFLLNFQGYRPETDALAELSLCRQQEKESLREYYKKFLLLKSQLPLVDDHIAIHYAISGIWQASYTTTT
jgi:hypothetical protein